MIIQNKLRDVEDKFKLYFFSPEKDILPNISKIDFDDDVLGEKRGTLYDCNRSGVMLLKKYKNRYPFEYLLNAIIKEHKFKNTSLEFKTFKKALFDKIEELRGKKKIDYRIQKNKIESKMISIDSTLSEDSSTSILDTIQGNENVENNIENNENREFLQNLINIGIVDKKQQKLFLQIFYLDNLYELTSLSDLVKNLGNKDFTQTQIQKLLIKNAKRSKTIRKCICHLFSFDTYAAIVEYLIKNKKLKIPELIIDFYKIRNYLSILFYNDDIKDKASFVKKCDGSVSSYEKEIHRILSLFKTDKKIFEFKDELKNCTPIVFSKIYDTHTVPNLVSNYLILDVLQQCTLTDTEEKEIKLAKIVEVLFPDNSQCITTNDINNFRKYNLLPRLKEMEEYGFITINKEHRDKYSFCAKFLNNEQKNALRYVIPFFCGIYPFASIGHFLANRLDIKDIFNFETYSINNILDECIIYDLLEVINNNKTIKKLVFKNKSFVKDFKPSELFIEKETGLLKVKSNKKEYYLHDINEVDYYKNAQNPIFNEIYSYYYKIYEEVARKYKKNKVIDIKIIEKYGSKDSQLYFNENIMKMLSNLHNIALPLTKLELRWLKTIMQDSRFDLFVEEADKKSLEMLVKDVKPFNLAPFKIYDFHQNIYKNVISANLPKEIEDKDLFKDKLKILNSALFSIRENSFKELNYKSM